MSDDTRLNDEQENKVVEDRTPGEVEQTEQMRKEVAEVKESKEKEGK